MTTESHQLMVNVLVRGSRRFNDNIRGTQTRMGRFRGEISDFNKTMGLNMKNFKVMNPMIQEMGGKGSRSAAAIRRFTHGLRGFRMEMLGVMFFGMMMQKFFTGLLKPAGQLTGLFELVSLTLQVLFLPIMLAILDMALPFIDFLIGLSDKTKMLIGTFVLFAAGIGLFLFILGSFALGIGSVILVFGGLFNIIDRLIPDVSVLGVEMSSFLEAGLSLTILTSAWELMKKAVDKVLSVMLELQFVKDILQGLGIEIDENLSAWEIFQQAISGIWDKIRGAIGFGESLEGEGNILTRFFTEIKNKAENFKNEFQAKMDELNFDNIMESVNSISDSIKDLTPSIKTLAGALETVAKVLDFVTGFFSWLVHLLDRIPGLVDKIISAFERLSQSNFNLNPFSLVKRAVTESLDFSGGSPVGASALDFGSGGGPSFFQGGSSPTSLILNQTLTFQNTNADEIQRIIDESNKTAFEEFNSTTSSNSSN